jgi:hypothetical protein
MTTSFGVACRMMFVDTGAWAAIRDSGGETLLGERVSTFVYLLPDDIRRAWKISRTHTYRLHQPRSYAETSGFHRLCV